MTQLNPDSGSTAARPGQGGTASAGGRGGRRRRSRPSLGALLVCVGIPVVAAVFYGGFGAHLYRITGHALGWTILLGAIMTVASAILMISMMLFRNRMVPEVRGTVFGAVFGAMSGWMYNVAGTASPLRATLIGALLGAAMALCAVYVFYNFGAKGHPQRPAAHQPGRAPATRSASARHPVAGPSAR